MVVEENEEEENGKMRLGLCFKVKQKHHSFFAADFQIRGIFLPFLLLSNQSVNGF
jgi:hypothetical protein